MALNLTDRNKQTNKQTNKQDQTGRKILAYLLHQGQSTGVGDGRGRIRHRTHHGHSSCQSSCRARGEILLMCGTRLPKVNMHVDQTYESITKERFDLFWYFSPDSKSNYIFITLILF